MVIMGSSVPGRVSRCRPAWRKYMIRTIRLVSTIVFIGLSETNTIGYYLTPSDGCGVAFQEPSLGELARVIKAGACIEIYQSCNPRSRTLTELIDFVR